MKRFGLTKTLLITSLSVLSINLFAETQGLPKDLEDLSSSILTNDVSTPTNMESISERDTKSNTIFLDTNVLDTQSAFVSEMETTNELAVGHNFLGTDPAIQ